jgi:hypothetical protein
MLKRLNNISDTAILGILLLASGIGLVSASIVAKNETKAIRRQFEADKQAWADHKKLIRADIETREGDRAYRVVSQHLQELGL